MSFDPKSKYTSSNRSLIDELPESIIQDIINITKTSPKSPIDIENLRKLLTPLRFVSTLFEEISKEYQQAFLNGLEYQFVPAFEHIIHHEICSLYLYILIKGKAVKLIQSFDRHDHHSIHKKKIHKNLIKAKQKIPENERDDLLEKHKQLTLEELGLALTELNGTDDQTNLLKASLTNQMSLSDVHPGLRRDYMIRKFIFQGWRAYPKGRFYEDLTYMKYINKEKNEVWDTNLRKAYKLIEINDQRIYIPMDQSKDYVSIFNFIYPEMIITQLLCEGSHFGGETVYFGNDSKNSVIAIEDCHLLLLCRRKYRKMIAEYYGRVYAKRMKILNSISILHGANSKMINFLCRDWSTKIYTINSVIYKEGDRADKVYIIIHGSVEISKIIEKNDGCNHIHKSADLTNTPSTSNTTNTTTTTNTTITTAIQTKLIKINSIWNKHMQNSIQQRFSLAILSQNQIFGDVEIIGPLISNFRNSKATVISDTAEIYEVLGETFISFLNKKEAERIKMSCTLKQEWRDQLQARDVKIKREFDRLSSETRLRCDYLQNNNNTTTTTTTPNNQRDHDRLEQIKKKFLSLNKLNSDDTDVLRSTNMNMKTMMGLNEVINMTNSTKIQKKEKTLGIKCIIDSEKLKKSPDPYKKVTGTSKSLKRKLRTNSTIEFGNHEEKMPFNIEMNLKGYTSTNGTMRSLKDIGSKVGNDKQMMIMKLPQLDLKLLERNNEKNELMTRTPSLKLLNDNHITFLYTDKSSNKANKKPNEPSLSARYSTFTKTFHNFTKSDDPKSLKTSKKYSKTLYSDNTNKRIFKLNVHHNDRDNYHNKANNTQAEFINDLKIKLHEYNKAKTFVTIHGETSVMHDLMSLVVQDPNNNE